MSDRDKVCAHCGKAFYAMHMKTKFCSGQCRQKYFSDKRRLGDREVSCKGCGVSFFSRNRQKLYCSADCRWKHCNASRPTTKDKWRTCPECGTRFQPYQARGVGRTYCTASCRGKARYKRKKPVSSDENRELRIKYKWDGNWQAALTRDKYTCQLCKKQSFPSQWITYKSKLLVHHLDGSGEKESKNHDIDNLMTLCYPCHSLFHTKINLVQTDGKWFISGSIFNKLGISHLETVS